MFIEESDARSIIAEVLTEAASWRLHECIVQGACRNASTRTNVSFADAGEAEGLEARGRFRPY